MRVVLDECLPRRLGLELSGHLVSTVPQEGWAGLSNGKLLARIQGNHDAFITVDKNLPVQQMTAALSFGVIVLRTPSNKLEDVKRLVKRLVPQILAALSLIQPGQVVLVSPA
jgi:hypothetical protein